MAKQHSSGQMLQEAKADANAQGGVYGNALQATAASFRENTEVIRILLDIKANANFQGGK